MNHYDEGWKAYEDGKSLEDNPYPEGSLEHYAWGEGWTDCEEEENS